MRSSSMRLPGALLLATTIAACAAEADPNGAAVGEDDVVASSVYVADLGPMGLEFYARRGGKTAKLSHPGELTGAEDGPGTGTVRVGGPGCATCLFFEHPRTKKPINVARATGRTLSLRKEQFSFEADGFEFTSPIVKVQIAPNDPEHGELKVAWP